MNTNDFYDPFTHPENSTLLIDFMLMANACGVSTQSLLNSVETFNSANCSQASFRDKINEEIAKTCCCQTDQLNRDIYSMRMHQAQWSMIEDTIGWLHSASASTRNPIDCSILQSSKTSFDPDSRVFTIEHDAEGVTFYVDNMPYETVGSTISKSSKPSSSAAMIDLYVNKVVTNDILLSDVPIALRNEVEQKLKELGLIEEIDDIVSMAKHGIISPVEARYRIESMKPSSIEETKTDESEKWIEAIKDLKHSFTERTDLEKEKTKSDDIYAGDGFIMRTLRKLVAAANTVIGWIVDELTYDL